METRKYRRHFPISKAFTRDEMRRRLFASVEVDANDCWIYLGARDGRGDQGVVNFEGKMWTASRFAFTLVYGEVPKGIFIRHICDNGPCINPFHLVPGTPKQNVEDMIERGRDRFWGNAPKNGG